MACNLSRLTNNVTKGSRGYIATNKGQTSKPIKLDSKDQVTLDRFQGGLHGTKTSPEMTALVEKTPTNFFGPIYRGANLDAPLVIGKIYNNKYQMSGAKTPEKAFKDKNSVLTYITHGIDFGNHAEQEIITKANLNFQVIDIMEIGGKTHYLLEVVEKDIADEVAKNTGFTIEKMALGISSLASLTSLKGNNVQSKK